MKEYDIIVVGAGPAGIPAAEAAARYGAETLLLEKNEIIMAKKPCGEATSLNTFRDMKIKPKPYIVIHKVMPRVFAPDGRYIDVTNAPTYSINKTMYLQELALKAAEAGVKIKVREEFECLSKKDNRYVIKTSKEIYSTRVLIGADGYNSSVAHCLGIKEKSEPITTLIYLMVNVKLKDYESARFYLGRNVAPRGYAWIFPKGEKIAEVGVGVRGGVAKTYLDKFVNDHGDELGQAQIIDYRGAPVPIGGLINKNYGDGFILVGDAAGTVIPLTGAGIHSSGVAGRVAGEVAAKAVAVGNWSDNMMRLWREQYSLWIDKINVSLKIMRFLEKLDDNELNELRGILKEDDIAKLANGENVKKIGMRLLKKPGIAFKLAKAIL